MEPTRPIGPGKGSGDDGERKPGNALDRPARGGPATLLADAGSWRSSTLAMVPDHLTAALPLRELLRILHKHRLMILAVVSVMVMVVGVVTYRIKPVFEAAARIEINGETPDLSNLRELFLQMPTTDDYVQTQVRILQSDDLAMQTVRALRLYEDPQFAVRPAGSNANAPFTSTEELRLIEAFHSHLSVTVVRSSRLVEAKFESTSPKLAADAVNTLADLYVENNFRKKYESAMQASDWMAGQLRELKVKMEQSHEALVKYERDNQIFALDQGQNVTVSKLGDLNRSLTEAESDRMAKESQYELVKTHRLDDLAGVMQNSLLQDLQRQRSQVTNSLAEARATLGPKHPKVLQYERQLQDLESQMEAQMKVAAGRIESDYQAAMNREQLLRRAFEQQKNEANAFNSKLVEYSLLRRDYETNQQLYEGLLQRLKEAGIASGLRSSNIHVVDRARPPINPVRPRKSLNLMLSLIVGLALGCALALFNEYLDNSVKIPEDVEQLVNLPVLGIIPAVSSVMSYASRHKPPKAAVTAGTGSELATVAQPQSVVSEAYRALRTSILLSTSRHAPQLILISSGQPREGKTTTALNLAITLAQRGDRVVLIDTDLRRPRIHRSFQLSNDRGLSTYLTSQATPEELARPVRQVPNLFVITSGPTPPNPAELLSSEPLEALFAELRRHFDFIVLDSPPAISVADSMILAAHADGVMLVVHGGVTTRETLKHTTKLMNSVNARILGIVLNNVDVRSVDYKYYYMNYYGDYYRHMLEGQGYGYGEDREARGETRARS
ncbi:MAG TPA: polysaccharide biosynthesis tyrosine autokinase [Candidatus Acidoferrales bacterium]|nr:polysaccharide biosynthesis tyrosine autokinase [Candidatus Acidoferrales bacterium]